MVDGQGYADMTLKVSESLIQHKRRKNFSPEKQNVRKIINCFPVELPFLENNSNCFLNTATVRRAKVGKQLNCFLFYGTVRNGLK
jgi:hypothetical protein